MATQEIIGDMRTTITSGLAGALVGQLANRAGDYVIDAVGVHESDLGHQAARFVIQSAAASLTYYAAAQLMPGATSNPYFGWIFFSANTGLTSATLNLSQQILSGLD